MFKKNSIRFFFLTDSAVADIVTQFNSSRASLPPLVIATPTDHTHWSTPSPPVFARLQLLAKESLRILLDPSTSDFKVLLTIAKTT